MRSAKMQVKMSERLMDRLDETSQRSGIGRTELVRQMIDEGITRRGGEGEWHARPSKNASGKEIALHWVPNTNTEGDAYWKEEARALVKALWMWMTTPRMYASENGQSLKDLVEELKRNANGETREGGVATAMASAEMEPGVTEDDVKMLRGWGQRARKEQQGILDAINTQRLE